MRKKSKQVNNITYHKGTCWFCNKGIKDRATNLDEMKPLHKECRKLIVDRLCKIYKRYIEWEKGLNEEERKIVMILKQKPITIDKLQKETKLSYSKICSILTKSKLKVRVKTVINGNTSIEYALKDDYEVLQAM